MRSLVRFGTARGLYALPVEHTVGVRSAAGLVPLPAPAPGVVGLLADDEEPLTVLSVLGEGDAHVVVVEVGGRRFGVHATEVAGVVAVDEARFGPPPGGQERLVVAATAHLDDGLVLVVDAAALAAFLGGPPGAGS